MYLNGHNWRVFDSDYSATVGTTTASLTAYTTNLSFPPTHAPQADALYVITGYNQSTATDVTVIAQNLHRLFGPSSTDCWSELTRWSIEKTTSTSVGTIKEALVQGMFMGSGVSRLAVQNVSTGSSDLNATVYFRVTKV
jgi:hypothetical protein